MFAMSSWGHLQLLFRAMCATRAGAGIPQAFHRGSVGKGSSLNKLAKSYTDLAWQGRHWRCEEGKLPGSSGGRFFHSTGSLEEQAETRDASSSLAEELGASSTFQGFENAKVGIVGDGRVGIIFMDRPKALNAVSKSLFEELIRAFRLFDASPEVHAVVLTGLEKAFAAGADIKEMQHATYLDACMERVMPFSDMNHAAGMKIPLIAAVNGYALGGGCELAMLCDIVLAGEKAVFGQPEVKLGVIPGFGGTQRLIREVGKSRAMEMVLTGEYFMSAKEACDRGLVSRVIPGSHKDLVLEAIEVGKKIGRLSRPVVSLAKDAVDAAYEMGLQEGLKKEHSLFAATFGLDDHKEGMSAFVEKRAARFRGQ